MSKILLKDVCVPDVAVPTAAIAPLGRLIVPLLNNDSDRFDPHVDVLDHHTSRRFLAFFIYVNDVEVGGETKFLNFYKPGTYIPFTVTPKQGRLLMFPPMWPWYHAGLKPESGNKYLIHSYCHYA